MFTVLHGFFHFFDFSRQAATKKRLEELKIDETSNIETIAEINEPVFNPNIRDTLVINEAQKNSVDKPNKQGRRFSQLCSTKTYLRVLQQNITRNRPASPRRNAGSTEVCRVDGYWAGQTAAWRPQIQTAIC